VLVLRRENIKEEEGIEQTFIVGARDLDWGTKQRKNSLRGERDDSFTKMETCGCASGNLARA
jgi:hypothetical protein